MKLNELLKKYDVSEELSTKVAFLLAYFGALNTEENEEEISEDDLYCYDWNEINVSDYDLECGAYHNGIWFSLEKVIKVLVECEQTYD